MKILISTPTGYNARELLLPLRDLLNNDSDITEVQVVTPAADYSAELFPTFSEKFTFYNTIKNLQPDVILTPTAGLDPNDVPILEYGKINHIPTITFIASWDNVFKMDRLKSHKLPYVMADYFAVWNKMNAKHLVKNFDAIHEHDVEITGPPRFDYFSHTDKILTKKQLLDYLSLSSTDTPLIHGATTELYPFEYIWKIVTKAQDQNLLPNKLNKYSSIHPGGNLDNHDYSKHNVVSRYSFGRRNKSPHPNFSYLPTDQETYLLVSLFIHANLLINQSSTVAIESALADTPIINIKFGKRFDFWRWRRSMVYRDFQQHYKYITKTKGTSLVHNSHQLIETIQKYLQDPEYKKAERLKLAKKLITHTDGSCSQRLLDFVKKHAA